MKKARYFYAASTHNTWPKLFVLTDDGLLYSEYLDFMKPAFVKKTVDFNDFTTADYKWNGYQTIDEITYSEAINKTLQRQDNWVSGYVERNSIEH